MVPLSPQKNLILCSNKYSHKNLYQKEIASIYHLLKSLSNVSFLIRFFFEENMLYHEAI